MKEHMVSHAGGGLLAGALIACLSASTAFAAPTTYMDRASFDAAVAGIAGTSQDVLDFDSVSAGTVFPSGGAYQGVTFSYSLSGGYELAVSNEYPGTSGSNTLKVSDNGGTSFGQFALGDEISFSFAGSHAFGMYIIVGDSNFDFYDNDINLSFAGITLSNVDADTATPVGPDNVAALFVGIVDPNAVYTSAILRFGPVGSSSGGLFEIDDIAMTSPVPEPGMLPLWLAGLIGVALTYRKRTA